jgi:hypothetical protein
MENMKNTNIVTLEKLVVKDGELHIRHISADIAEIFEDLLADNDILIPDEEREGDESEAALYGDTYSEFEDDITEQLVDVISGLRNGNTNTASATEHIYESFVALLNAHEIQCPHDKKAVFSQMDACLTKAIEIAVNNPLPINDWEY